MCTFVPFHSHVISQSRTIRIAFQSETRMVDNHRIKSMLNGIHIREQDKYGSEVEEGG
ncbi:hypothetical protein L6472_04460 [Prevotella sp. E13-17]|uniref:hypothetical protein n=1 Tax=Prevotella sp. E13-17 TaxID=2913616 RepID=UPI001EDA3134|nr:hypothetical protein [Prevotella sp. E13-17]UKK51842.1 hypothetical protein L6472_04460 [Prevotella sp. E13-17]